MLLDSQPPLFHENWCQSMFKKAELVEFKERLLVLRSRIRGDVKQLTDSALHGGRSGADSKSPTHIAELGTDAYEQDFSLRVAENDQGVLNEIEDALLRIENGEYGCCPECVAEGKSPAKSRIPKARLRAIPYTRCCVEHERKREELSP